MSHEPSASFCVHGESCDCFSRRSPDSRLEVAREKVIDAMREWDKNHTCYIHDRCPQRLAVNEALAAYDAALEDAKDRA